MRKITFFLVGLLLTGLSLKGQTVQHSTVNVDSLFQLLDTSSFLTAEYLWGRTSPGQRVRSITDIQTVVDLRGTTKRFPGYNPNYS